MICKIFTCRCFFYNILFIIKFNYEVATLQRKCALLNLISYNQLLGVIIFLEKHFFQLLVISITLKCNARHESRSFFSLLNRIYLKWSAYITVAAHFDIRPRFWVTSLSIRSKKPGLLEFSVESNLSSRSVALHVSTTMRCQTCVTLEVLLNLRWT